MPRPLHEEGGIPAERSFTTADIRWACRCAGRVGTHEDREAEFLVEFAEATGRSLESVAIDCRMKQKSYEYLRMECFGDGKALRGLERIKAFRERVSKMVLKEAYNRKKKQNTYAHKPTPFKI